MTRPRATRQCNKVEYQAALYSAQRRHILLPPQELAAGPPQANTKAAGPRRGMGLLADFSGNPPYGMPTITKLIKEYIPQVHMEDEPPSFDEFKRTCQGKQRSWVGPDGVPHRLLGMLPDEHLRTLHAGVSAVWKTGDIPTHWLRSEVVLMCKKRDPERPENHRPTRSPTVSTVSS